MSKPNMQAHLFEFTQLPYPPHNLGLPGSRMAERNKFDGERSYFYYAPEGTSGGILKSHRPSVRTSVRQSVRPLQLVSQRYLINYWSQFDETSQKSEELGSYAQGQGHNQVKGQIVPKIVLLINYWSKFDETSQKDEA